MVFKRPGGLFAGGLLSRPPGLTGGAWDLLGRRLEQVCACVVGTASFERTRLIALGIHRIPTGPAISPSANRPVVPRCLHHNEGRQSEVCVIW